MELDQNGVHVGKDGWLFLTGGSNDVLRLFTDQTVFTAAHAKGWAERLFQRQQRLGKMGVEYFHMWAPDKLALYRHKVNFDPDILVVDPTKMVLDETVAMNAGTLFIDPLPELQAQRGQHLLYWKTDSHWTYRGACAAYQAICQRLEVAQVADLTERPIISSELILDLGGKLVPPRKESWGGAQVLRDAKVVYRNEMVKLLGILQAGLAAPMLRGTSIAFQNARATCDKRRVLLFGDSFSEYRPHLLTGLLAETFRNVLFVWSSSIDYGLVEDFCPDIVITETAERFVTMLPDDCFDLSVFVSERLTNFLNSSCGSDGTPFACHVGRHMALIGRPAHGRRVSMDPEPDVQRLNLSSPGSA